MLTSPRSALLAYQSGWPALNQAPLRARPQIKDCFQMHKIIFACLLLAGCAGDDFEVASKGAVGSGSYRVVDVVKEGVPLPPSEVTAPLETMLPTVGPGEYLIGVGDLVSVFVFDHPELTVPLADGERTGGFLVQADGSFAYPFLGKVEARGRTVSALREELSERLAQFIPNPQVDVRVVGFNSQRVVVGGSVARPATLSITSWPLTLLEAVNGAGGLTEDADASRVVVRRGGAVHVVNLESYLSAESQRNNPTLFGGDVVSVPRRAVEEVFILGEIVNPSAVALDGEKLSLTQAIARSGGLERVRANATGVFVFRAVGGETMVYQIDLTSPTAMILGSRFFLAPSDIVYVSRSPIQKWNDTISRILPTLGAVRSVQN